ncbi:MAG: alpha/beta hydrolase [Burkholderiales bacterium]|nr:alpha/beta hydrolase [Burkholderiales bacterium]
MSLQSFFANLYLRRQFKGRYQPTLNVAHARASVQAMARRYPPPPKEIRHTRVPADAARGLCPAEWLAVAQPQRTVLYLHGGGYFFCNLDTHRPVCSYLARVAQAQVLSVDYRLAPEHPFPAAVDDALAWYRKLLDDGIRPENLVIAGDSAGAGLALATLLAARDAGLPMPACALLFSPWVDLACAGETMQTLAKADVMFQPHLLPQAAALYLDGRAADEPLASPLYGDLHGLPPMLIHASNHEVLLADSLRLHGRAQAAGVSSELIRRDRLPHVWPTMVMLPEARASLKQSAAFIERHTR